jgi:hypothetical protein
MNENSGFKLNLDVNSQAGYLQLVNAVLSYKPEIYWQERNEFNQRMQNTSISKAFEILTKNQPFLAFSHQIMMSASIERITGTFISKKNQLLRGFLLNWEKTLLLFHFFQQIGENEDLINVQNSANRGTTSIRNLFEDIWGESFPCSVIRPGEVNTSFDLETTTRIYNELNYHRRLCKQITKEILDSRSLKNRVKGISFLSRDEILNTGIAGPFARVLNINPKKTGLTTSFDLSSPQFYQQYAYASSFYPFALIEICLTELNLALERLSLLLPKIQGQIKVNDIRESQGQFTCSLPVCFGVNHLSIELDYDLVKYINFIPFEMGNLLGITELIRKNEKDLYPLLFLYLNPEITIK